MRRIPPTARPDDSKALVDAAHDHGLMMFLDVVYNHFGPDGNYLHAYAPQFFREDHKTPWGPAIDFRRPEVRAFFTGNVLMWLMEYRFDGLRFDAVHAIEDQSWVDEMAATVRATVEPGRHVHLVLEHHNDASHLERDVDAQWNDDGHNVLHVLLTGEDGGYYADYADHPADKLARCPGRGLGLPGRAFHLSRRAARQPQRDLPPTAHVLFLQNHDQIGNRALGERLTVADRSRGTGGGDRAAAAVAADPVCCSWVRRPPAARPSCSSPTTGRSWPKLCAKAAATNSPALPTSPTRRKRERIPDPNAPATFQASLPVPDPEQGAGAAGAVSQADRAADAGDRAAPGRRSRHRRAGDRPEGGRSPPSAFLAMRERSRCERRGEAIGSARSPGDHRHPRRSASTSRALAGESDSDNRHQPRRRAGAVRSTRRPPAVRQRRAAARLLPGHCTAAFLDRTPMNDEALRDLARRAGIAVEWHDYANRPQVVAPDALRRILAALDLPADTRGDLAASRRLLAKRATLTDLPPLVTATAGRPTRLDLGAADPRPAKLMLERGGSRDLTLMPGARPAAHPGGAGDRLPPAGGRRARGRARGGAGAMPHHR